jgi:tetratricopeptide (TPR) repeat protein
VHLEQGNLEEAEKRLTASLQFHSSDVETYNRLGLVLRKQRKYEKALQCYQMALTVHPEHGGIYYNMGILFATKGDYDSARVYFESALAVDPNFEEARKMLQRMDRMGESSV